MLIEEEIKNDEPKMGDLNPDALEAVFADDSDIVEEVDVVVFEEDDEDVDGIDIAFQADDSQDW